MGEGKAGICGDGTIERLDRAGVHGQLRLTGLYVGVPRGERRRGQGESVSVRQYDGLIRYSTRNDTISLDARERGLLARKGLVCDLAIGAGRYCVPVYPAAHSQDPRLATI